MSGFVYEEDTNAPAQSSLKAQTVFYYADKKSEQTRRNKKNLLAWRSNTKQS